MPFTLSHAAAILPFSRELNRWRTLSAAVIGSMVPDFALMLPWNATRLQTHSMLSLLTFCLPVGLLFYWLFEYLVKPTAREVLTDAAYLRSSGFAEPDSISSAWQWLKASLAILAGAITHLAWDGFTHEGARGVRMIPLLDDPVEIGGHPLLAFRLAQHASSILGLAVVLYIMWKAVRAGGESLDAPQRQLHKASRRRWMAAYVGAALMFCAASYVLADAHDRYQKSLTWVIEAVAIGGLRGLIFSLLAVSLLLKARLRAAVAARNRD